ncbi:MAG: indolepyruvate oxidoreductase subunit beta [Candidatus Cryptobacteroides sp.]
MKKDIILCGVGGQGILTIATVIGQAATAAGINLKQAEVHGMSQRGGDVQSNLRLSTEKIWSDLIPEGKADLIISMEPMEALRYLPYLSEDGMVVTSTKAMVNIPNYPEIGSVLEELGKLPRCLGSDIEALASGCSNPKGANMVLLGMAAPHLGILGTGQLREAVACIFTKKGEAAVAANLKAFDAGLAASAALMK